MVKVQRFVLVEGKRARSLPMKYQQVASKFNRLKKMHPRLRIKKVYIDKLE